MVGMVEGLVDWCREQFPEAGVVYVGMFPRHVKKCCRMEGHLNEDDLWILNNNRMEVEREIVRRVEKKCEIAEWYELAAVGRELKNSQLLSEDQVHLTDRGLQFCCH